MIARSIRMNHDSGAIVTEYVPTSYFLSVRLIKDGVLTMFPVVYGYLYNWYAATDVRNIANDGWHVPTRTEMTSLITAVGGALISGGVLKETGTIYWNTPNTGATNAYGFNMRGSGQRYSEFAGIFDTLNVGGLLWTSTVSGTAGKAYARQWYYDNAGTGNVVQFYADGLSIRLIKDTTVLADGEQGVYTGNDGRIYHSICIGGIEYLSENLCETLYRDGTPIPEVTGNAAWAALSTGARCSYNNLESNAHA
jgi:uncharacterized protein (TIGR02145 family)